MLVSAYLVGSNAIVPFKFFSVFLNLSGIFFSIYRVHCNSCGLLVVVYSYSCLRVRLFCSCMVMFFCPMFRGLLVCFFL